MGRKHERERRRTPHEHNVHGEDLPHEHPGAVAQRNKRKKSVVGTVILLAAIAGVIYLASQGG